jgi:hypothetical protein
MPILTSIAPHSNRHRHLMHPSIHHHQENIFGPNDESIDIIIQVVIDNDATHNPVFVDAEGKMLEAPLFLKEELKNGIDFDPTKLCLDWSLENAHLILWWCKGGRNQMWTYKDETSTEGYYNYNNLYNVDADLCLDLTGGNTSPRMPVNLYHCTPRNNQLWIPPCSINKDKHDCTGGIKLLETPNRCLDADSPIKPSNQVILVGCDETLQAQQWTMIWTGVKDAKSGDYMFISLWILLPRNLKVLVLPKSQASLQVKRKEVLKGKPFRVVNSFV